MASTESMDELRAGNFNSLLNTQTIHPNVIQDVDRENHNLDLSLTRTVSVAQSMSSAHEVFFVIVICAGQLWTQYALGQAISILHVIGNYYDIANPGVLSWLIAGYSLTVGTFILISGRMGDTFGYKKMLLIGYSWFALWSMIAGFAVYSNQVLFIFARVFQGIGPSIILPNSLAILGAAYAPGPRKSMVFSLFGATAPNGSILGAVFSAVFALRWWPWAFWFTAMALVLTAVSAFFIIPDSVQKIPAPKSWRHTLSDLDLAGGLIGVTALVLINFAWNQSAVATWSTPYVYVTQIVGILIIPFFFLYESRFALNPLIPLEDMTSEVAFVLACIACGWACFGIWFYYVWQFIELLRGAGPLLATAWISPVCVSGVLASLATGKLLSVVRPAWVMTIALTAFTIGTIILATCPVNQVYWAQLFVTTVIMPWGMDMSFPAGTLILSNAVAKEKQGVAASLVNTVVNYSISLGLGFAGTVEGQINNGGHNASDLLIGYRGALYMGIGLGALGMMVSLSFVAKGYFQDRKERTGEKL